MIDMTVAMPPYRASMKIDFDDGKPMEVEAIYGNPLRTARAVGAAMPLVETLYRQLKFLDHATHRDTAQRSRPVAGG
jgi:2-dehydropantoate 2-reductase